MIEVRITLRAVDVGTPYAGTLQLDAFSSFSTYLQGKRGEVNEGQQDLETAMTAALLEFLEQVLRRVKPGLTTRDEGEPVDIPTYADGQLRELQNAARAYIAELDEAEMSECDWQQAFHDLWNKPDRGDTG